MRGSRLVRIGSLALLLTGSTFVSYLGVGATHTGGFWPWDNTTWGTALGFIGGRHPLQTMRDNPNYMDH